MKTRTKVSILVALMAALQASTTWADETQQAPAPTPNPAAKPAAAKPASNPAAVKPTTPAEPKKTKKTHGNTVVQVGAGVGTFLEKLGPLSTFHDNMPPTSDHQVSGIVGANFHHLKIRQHTLTQGDGLTTIGVGKYGDKTDVRVTSNVNVIGGVRAGPLFAVSGVKLSLDTSLANPEAVYRDRSVAVPVFAGVTFEPLSGLRALVGPVVQYRVGENPYGKVDAMEAGGRILLSDKSSKTFVMGEIVRTVAGEEYTGSAIQCNLTLRTQLGQVAFGADASVITMSDRLDKNGLPPENNKSTEVSDMRIMATAGVAWK